jgi:SOS-response transcriptional repressor LexA
VVVRVNSETITRQLLKREDGWYLIADDPREREIKITEDLIVEKVGVVIAAIVKY